MRTCIALVVFASAPAAAQCTNLIARQTYTGGFQATDFAPALPSNNVVLVGATPNTGIQLSSSTITGFAQSTAELLNADTFITRLRIDASSSLNFPGCQQLTDRVDLSFSYSATSGNWPIASSYIYGPIELDLLGLNLHGSRLNWRADFVAANAGCSPNLATTTTQHFNIQYQAIKNAQITNVYTGLPWTDRYAGAAAVPIADVIVNARYEPTSSSWGGNEKAYRGHLDFAFLYYVDGTGFYRDNTATKACDNTVPWAFPPAACAPYPRGWRNGWSDPPDAGWILSQTSPAARKVYYGGSGRFDPTQPPPSELALNQDRWPAGYPNAGKLVYDFNGDNVVDGADATWLMHWTLGWQDGTAQITQRSWKLGAIMKSTPAILTPPRDPWWLSRSATPGAEKIAFDSFRATNANRPVRILVGAQDGMVHAFNFGHFQSTPEPYGSFVADSLAPGGRGHGDGTESWAYIPSGEMASLKNNPPQVAGLPMPASPPKPLLRPSLRASVDAPVTLADVYLPGAIRTGAFIAQGLSHPYVTAIDVTDATQPRPLWLEDWPPAATPEPEFLGTDRAPTVGPMATPAGRKWLMATGNGMSLTQPYNEWLYFVDLEMGRTFAKLQLSGPVERGIGLSGSPVMYDFDKDGEIDRVYVTDVTVDASGKPNGSRLFKINTKTWGLCKLADVPEPVFAPMAASLNQQKGSSAFQVDLFLGGADHPDLRDTLQATPYHAFHYVDKDPLGGCTLAALAPGYPFALPAGHKIWATPTVISNGNLNVAGSGLNKQQAQVFFGTAVGDTNDICGSTGDGAVFPLLFENDLTAISNGCPGYQLWAAYANGTRRYDCSGLATSHGGSITNIMVAYRGHLMFTTAKNGLGAAWAGSNLYGSTEVIGDGAGAPAGTSPWNDPFKVGTGATGAPSGPVTAASVITSSWAEQ